MKVGQVGLDIRPSTVKMEMKKLQMRFFLFYDSLYFGDERY